MRTTTRRLLKVAASLAMFLVAFVGCVNVAFAFVGWYMVASGTVQPGEPMYLDELAPTGQASLDQLLYGAAFIVVALVSRIAIRRTLSSAEPVGRAGRCDE